MRLKNFHTFILLAPLAMGLVACASNGQMADTGMMQDEATMQDEQMMGQEAEIKMVGGAPMYPSKNIIQNAVNSEDHTTLVAAVKAAGLVETLSGPGPFTVFAPTNAAFEALPEGTVETLLKPENKATLTRILTYHVVPGALDASALLQKIEMSDGTATLTTVAGDPLTVSIVAGDVVITDENGNTATVIIADVYQSNGVIHVVDTVLRPQ